MNFLECVKNGETLKATVLLETVLKQKTLAFIKESKAEISQAVYGNDDEDVEDIEEETEN